jgi:hypothetical protein
MDAGNKSRTYEKEHGLLNQDLYTTWKEKRDFCDKLSTKIQLNTDKIKHHKSQKYKLNKVLQGYPYHDEEPTNIIANTNKDTVFTGCDPGIVTTGSFSSGVTSELQATLDRYYSLHKAKGEGHYYEHDYVDNTFSAREINHAVFSKLHQRRREKKQNVYPKKRLATERVTRKIRAKLFHKKWHSRFRNMLQNHSLGRKAKCIFFLGNWNQIGKRIKGHSRRSLKPLVQRVKSIKKDEFYIVNEFNTTHTCNSCFEPIGHQQICRAGKVVSIQGTLGCRNKKCPRQLTTKATCINRVYNGAKNIALVGYSQLKSPFGKPIPPFRPNRHLSVNNTPLEENLKKGERLK